MWRGRHVGLNLKYDMGRSTCERERERAHDMCNECVLIVMFSLLFCFLFAMVCVSRILGEEFGRDKTTFYLSRWDKDYYSLLQKKKEKIIIAINNVRSNYSLQRGFITQRKASNSWFYSDLDTSSYQSHQIFFLFSLNRYVKLK